jgi:hypothetical protein
MLITPAMGTTCMTARTPVSGSQSRSRFNQSKLAGKRGGIELLPLISVLLKTRNRQSIPQLV